MRREFAMLLFNEMSKNKDIYLLSADLGFGLWDNIRDTYPNRFYNVGSAEQLLIGAGTGLALENKIPVCYSVTSFLLCRPFEWIRNYLNYEKIPVKLLGGGLNKDYGNLGFTHHSDDYKNILDLFPNICDFTPSDIEELRERFCYFIYNKQPSFMGLRRENH